MRRPFMHPRIESLSALSTQASPRPSRNVLAHVADCARCQQDVLLLRAALASRDADQVDAPRHVLERALEDRRQGSRVVLATEDAVAPRRGVRVGITAAALVLLALARLGWNASEAGAGTTHGELQFNPDSPRPGATIAVTYRAPQSLSAAGRPVVRAILRSANAGEYDAAMPVRTVMTLRRNRDNVFTGSFALPDSVWYGAFVVEDSSGAVVDDNGGRLWDLVAADADGRPAYMALLQRSHHLMGINQEEGFVVARQLTTLYPDSLAGWGLLAGYQSRIGLDQTDTVLSQRRAILDRFVRRGSAGDVGRLSWYARGVDSALALSLRDRALSERPDDPFSIQWRLVLGVLRSFNRSHDTTKALTDLDALWSAARGQENLHRRDQISTSALNAVALPSGRIDEIHKWARRAIEAAGATRTVHSLRRSLAEQYARIPVLRHEGMAALRAELVAIDSASDSERQLGETRARSARRHDAIRRELLAALGRALIARGERGAGLDALRLAVSSGWDVDLFREVAAVRKSAGDTAGSIDVQALVAADPRSTAADLDSLRSLLTRAGRGRGTLDSLLGRARSELVSRVLADAGQTFVSDSHVSSPDGRTSSVRQLTRGRITVVAFWSRFCGPAITDLPRMDAAAATLAARGIATISVVEEMPSADLTRWLGDRDVRMPVYHDRAGETQRAFNQWGTPNYYVLDREGRVRFGPLTSADEVLLRATALLWAEGR
jgi:hypothetical protein